VDTNDDKYAGSQAIQYTILPRSVIVKAMDATMTAGEQAPQLTYVVEGLLNGDSLTPTVSWDDTQKDTAGKYLISVKVDSAALSANYTPVLIPGTMTVEPAPQPDPDPDPADNPQAVDNAGGANGSGNAGSSGSSGSSGGSSSSDRDSDRSSGSGGRTNAATTSGSGTTTKQPFRFLDVPDEHWAAEAIYELVERGLVNGTATLYFSPDDPMTRQMLMTVLARANGVDTSGDPYTKGMSWAVQSGVSDGSDPTAQLTREQLATMLWRCAGKPDPTQDTLRDFTDAHQISDYARQAVQWAHENGVVQGKGDGILDPKGWATRAEVAEMLARYLAVKVSL
jgi:hypothetical protein